MLLYVEAPEFFFFFVIVFSIVTRPVACERRRVSGGRFSLNDRRKYVCVRRLHVLGLYANVCHVIMVVINSGPDYVLFSIICHSSRRKTVFLQ